MTQKHVRRLSPLAAVILTALIFMTAQPVISSVAGEDGTADVGAEGQEDGGGSAQDTLVVGEGGYITITAALKDATAGDTIAIDPGTYAEELVVSVMFLKISLVLGSDRETISLCNSMRVS